MGDGVKWEYPRALRDAGISKARYKELRAVCETYDDCRRAVAAARRGELDRRGGNGAWHAPDPTGQAGAAIADMWQQRRIRDIERAAVAAAPGIWRALIANVARGTPWERLDVACGRRYFYEARVRLYVALDEILSGHGDGDLGNSL